MSDDLASGEIARWLERLDKGQEELLKRFDSIRSELVTRSEWNMQNQAHLRDIALAENRDHDLATDIAELNEQVGEHRDTISRLKGVLWLLGGIWVAALAIVGAFIQSGRLWP